MKFNFFSLKPKPGGPYDARDRHYNSGSKSVTHGDEVFFNSIGRILKSRSGIRKSDYRLLDEKNIQELDEIREEIIRKNLDEDAKRLINDWKLEKPGSDYKEAVREFVSDSLNHIDVNLNYKKDKSGHDHPKTRRIIFFSSLAAIVSVLLLISNITEMADFEHIFNKYYEPFNLVGNTTRSTNDITHSIVKTAIKSYRDGDFNEAVTGFSKALKTDTTSYIIIFSLGLSELASGNLEGAIISLTKVLSNQGIYAAEATWYLGLTYLKSGNKDKAGECFARLAGNSGYYSEEAQDILRSLK